ncbi:FAD-dependent oxidoreductase [Saccharopolyspora elongata]|nr:FAD-dependent oxidoreductase [Saccharopolyspora elongata]
MSAPMPLRLVIVGCSLAGLRAARAARREGFEGSVVLVGREEHLPYDRPPLSKGFLVDDHAEATFFVGADDLNGSRRRRATGRGRHWS